MTPQHVISQLLASDSQHLKNSDLLKKIIITAYLGRLQINGQPPDNSIAFGNYLFDNEKILFDFTHASDKSRALFEQWLFEPHQKDKKKSYFTELSVNEYRGFTAEVQLNWFGKLFRWCRGIYTDYWKISDLDISLHYQLLGINTCIGQHGIAIAFMQMLVPPTGTKYKPIDDPQSEPMGNTKRVLINDKLIEHLLKLTLHSFNFETVCKGQHPLALHVVDIEKRYKEMSNYRRIQRYVKKEPWYIRLWNWLVSWFINKEPLKTNRFPPKESCKPSMLYENETTKIYQRGTQEILVKEKKPIIENLVFCGGGAKIFAHIGVWRALSETDIVPKRFAGSSAGAIMSLMCYLRYSAEDVAGFFRQFKQEHLIYFTVDSRGFSEPSALKTALDYAIAFKINKIVTEHKIPYPKGKITFTTLESIRLRCPNCGLGEELIVTATNKRLRTTNYFSLNTTPDMEVSEAVKISASMPLVLKGTFIDGDEYSDGGVLCNFPTDAIADDNSTLLESEQGTNMKTLAVQFDNGTERTAIDRIMDKVPRENFLYNWIYSLITGVADPASAWQQDLIRLRKYSAQSIVIDIGTIFSANFNIDEKSQQILITNGYTAAKDYLKVRYAKKPGSVYKNTELMYATFSSLEELLAYCCYKGQKSWYEIVLGLIERSTLYHKEHILAKAKKLHPLYFITTPKSNAAKNPPTFFGNQVLIKTLDEPNHLNHQVLLTLYPLVLKLTPRFLKNAQEHDLLERARHAFTINTLFACVRYFAQIKGETHIIFHVFCSLVEDLAQQHSEGLSHTSSTDTIYTQLALIDEFLHNKSSNLFQEHYYGLWQLNLQQRTLFLRKLAETNELTFELCCLMREKKADSIHCLDYEVYDDTTSTGQKHV